jgi:ribonuclease HI
MKRKKSSRSGKPIGQMNTRLIRIYIDGSGARPDRMGSGFAWFREDTKSKHTERCDGLTNNQAEYRAFLAALESAPKRTHIEILTDSQIVAYQFNGAYKAKEPSLAALLSEVHGLIRKNSLTVIVKWIPREQNLAGKLI